MPAQPKEFNSEKDSFYIEIIRDMMTSSSDTLEPDEIISYIESEIIRYKTSISRGGKIITGYTHAVEVSIEDLIKRINVFREIARREYPDKQYKEITITNTLYQEFNDAYLFLLCDNNLEGDVPEAWDEILNRCCEFSYRYTLHTKDDLCAKRIGKCPACGEINY